MIQTFTHIYEASITASIPSPPISKISIGSLSIHIYALCILLGIVLAALITSRRWKDRGFDPENLPDLVFVVVPAGIIGARLYHVFFTTPELFFGPNGDPKRIFFIWEGGLGIFGGIIFGALSAYIFCRIKKLDYVQLLDCLAPGVLVAQAVGRLGNWFNQELFGAPTNLPWALSVSPETAANTICPGGIVCSPTTTFHPTFLYEMILDLFSAAAIIIIERKVRLKLGQSFALYIIFYSFCRFIVEQFRIDYAHIIFGLRIHAWVAIIAFLLGIFAFIRFNKQRRRH